MPDHDQQFLDDYRAVVAFREDQFNPVLLARSERMKAALLCVASSQEIPLHSPMIDLVLFVLEGEGWIEVGDHSHKVRPGSCLFIPAGTSRGVKALSNLVALHVASPPPTPAEHREVMEALARQKGAS